MKIAYSAGILFAVPLVAGAAEPPIDYNRQIRPILSDTCFKCHGPDGKERQAGLRLDVRDVATKPVESGDTAIVPGKPAESELVRRIFATDDSLMPPAKSNKTLSAEQKELLKKWIEQGAVYQTHWAFVPPKPPALPKVVNSAWPRNGIDHFILAKLEDAGLRPSREADKTALLRRVTLDLTGLPPTLAEIDAFLADNSPDAYEKVVERLVQSPHHGERMALDWLDAARYADTHGYHIDSGRDMSRWREWVIDAFQRNLPYDRFTIEQLAGDLLPNPTVEQQVASGFNRNHMINFEGGAIPKEYHTAYIVDRVNTTATVWLGLSLACCQCHDHKFDPFTQKDYYQLFAFFHNVPENGLDGSKGNAMPFIKAPSKFREQELEKLTAAIERLERQLAEPNAAADQQQAAWEQTALSESVAWTVLDPTELKSAGGATLTKQDDKAILASGTNPATETYSLAARPDVAGITAIRLEVLPHDSFPAKGPGRSTNGNLVMTGVKAQAGTAQLKFKAASADFSQDMFPVANAIDGKPTSGWAIFPQVGQAHTAVFEFDRPVTLGADSQLAIQLEFRSQFGQHQAGRFRVSVTNSSSPHGVNKLPAAVVEALQKPADQRSDAQRNVLRSHFREQVAEATRPLAGQLATLRQQRDAAEKQAPTVMVMQEMPQPRETFILVRGQYDKHGDKVSADVPASLPPLPDGAPRNRLGLAQWLVSPQQPLTPRVTVNRYWQLFFSNGLVKTAEEFGSQGQPPTHPELLDWLATEFTSPAESATPHGLRKEHAWDVRALIRAIVTSATYRQSSQVTAESVARDPSNQLLARGPRFRLQAELIRDQALAISGLLNRRIGGPSVSPYQPKGLWEELMSRADGANWTAQTYVQSHGEDLYRRSMYTFWKRTSPPPTMATFDAPDRETCTVRRAITNTPLQALILLNDPTYVEASRKLAERILRECGPSPAERIAFAFRLATARRPTPAEQSVLERILEKQVARFRGNADAATKLLSVGESPRDEKLDAAELAAWTMISSAILNLDETVTKG